MIGIVYLLIIIFANTIGAVSGMGGGVIIKPIFDFINAHEVSSISFYSSAAVLTMSVVSTYRQLRNGIKINWSNVSGLAFGSIMGGYIGNVLFELFLEFYKNDSVTQGIQIILTIITLLWSFFYILKGKKSYAFTSTICYIGTGFILGTLASLLGIGGGPINVSLLVLLFSMPIKEATVYSICTILFSQLSKIITIGFTGGFSSYDLNILWYIIPAAIIGGILGAKASGMLNPQKISVVFQIIILLVLLLNIYNGIQLFI